MPTLPSLMLRLNVVAAPMLVIRDARASRLPAFRSALRIRRDDREFVARVTRSNHQTADMRLTPAARCARALRRLPPSNKKRAQGRPGARCTRGLVCNKCTRKRTRAYRFSGGNPAFPAQWFTAYSALSPAIRISCHRRPREVLLPANLTPTSRRQDHTASPSAHSSARQSRYPRPPHPTARS